MQYNHLKLAFHLNRLFDRFENLKDNPNQFNTIEQ